jgi:malonyl CoA-acyl carrier protein transacylase
MGKVAFIFSGQGAQKSGMGRDFYENSPLAKATYEKASELLALPMEKICFEKNDEINITEYTQAAILTTSIAMFREITSRGYRFDVTAGLSLGEYSALVASQVMTFEDAVQVVRQRGILMQMSIPQGQGGMAAVLGMSGAAVKAVVDDINGVSVANYNCPGQVVISGAKDAIEEACAKLKEAGAKRTLVLNVSGPFHSELLKDAGDKLGEVLADVQICDTKVPYVTNVTATYVESCENIKELLEQQVYSPVMWEQSVQTMLADGVDSFVEIGPGKTLSAFVKKISPDAKVYNVEKWEDLEGLEEFF